MFSDKVYKSWKAIQEEKYGEIFAVIGDKFLGIFSNKLALDIGSGEGYFEDFLAKSGLKHNIVGLDVDKDAVKECGFPCVIGDGNIMPFKDSSFDIIVSIDTMHLVDRADFHRVLKEGGLVVFSSFFRRDNCEERKKTIREKLDGFQILMEFEVRKQENEYVILARKTTSSPEA